MSVHNYQKIFDSYEGSLREKMCYLLTQYSHLWEWAGHGSMVSDILDNTQITPEEIVYILEGVQDFEGGNDEFSAALNVMRAAIVSQEESIPVTEKTRVNSAVFQTGIQAKKIPPQVRSTSS